MKEKIHIILVHRRMLGYNRVKLKRIAVPMYKNKINIILLAGLKDHFIVVEQRLQFLL